MHAEVISIGDELTSGQRLDTNTQWLAERLGELGVATLFHTTVGDDLQANVRVFKEALDRADLIVVTGGLGPTADDLTRQALADAVGVELVLDEPSLAHIQAMFSRRKREMPPANRVQAFFPRGSRVVPNPNGTAPGIDLQVSRPHRPPARIFCLPGVPAEMREMWSATVCPAIQESLGGERKVIRHQRIKCFGVGESDLEQMLPDLIRRGRDPQVGITVSKATITLRITAVAGTEDECRARMAPTIQTIEECLGDLIFGSEDDELQHAVVRALAQTGKSLAVAECGTRGLLASWLGEAAVASPRTFAGGLVVRDRFPLASADDASTNHDVGAWAERVRTAFGADLGLAIGPFPAPSDAGPGVVELAVADATRVVRHAYGLAGHPDIIAPRTAKQALNLIRLQLLPRQPR